MTENDITQLAMQARDEYMQAAGLSTMPWHLTRPEVRNAWRKTVATIVAVAQAQTVPHDHSTFIGVNDAP